MHSAAATCGDRGRGMGLRGAPRTIPPTLRRSCGDLTSLRGGANPRCRGPGPRPCLSRWRWCSVNSPSWRLHGLGNRVGRSSWLCALHPCWQGWMVGCSNRCKERILLLPRCTCLPLSPPSLVAVLLRMSLPLKPSVLILVRSTVHSTSANLLSLVGRGDHRWTCRSWGGGWHVPAGVSCTTAARLQLPAGTGTACITTIPGTAAGTATAAAAVWKGTKNVTATPAAI
mmetsp:Transcript_6182/g.14773  ORF Transcript_6182/g.14773 Transcript_6182/m.14773 type:complete len:228 (+) Transcript_6182:295-978(+)